MSDLQHRAQKGKEHGVTWTIDDSNYDPVIVTAESIKGHESITYKCTYRPIFGHDVDDISNIEIILENLIRKYATDRYLGT